MTALPMSEADLQTAVTDLCDTLHLRWFHSPDSRRENAGFPDMVILGSRAIIWRENKATSGRLRTQQSQWIEALRTVGQDVDIWRPVDLTSGRILHELRRIR